MISSIIMFIVFVAVLFFIIQPLFLDGNIVFEDTQESRETLLQSKKILYRLIKELDMDYQLGNVQEEDYIRSRNNYKKEVSDILSILNKK